MIDEGYVKYACDWQRGPAPDNIGELVSVRNRLHELGLIGKYEPSGIGFGNVSMRLPDRTGFVISGTATGGIGVADAAHFCLVSAWDIDRNSVACSGPVSASSESLTHAMLYATAPQIQAVLHVHHREFWEKLLEYAPSTKADVAYGTPAMAMEMKRLLIETGFPETQIFAMRGHEEGVLAYGPSLGAALNCLLVEFRKNQA
ncbi:MAG: hypothetical protein RLZZ519_317 [Bacteroidota bacterium]|jgi:L-ribulose-5-phosphate 4-epimerase